MRIFLSWSGETSRLVALALREWLPDVIQTVDPWMSTEDIAKGERWLLTISSELEANSRGIVVVTPDNQGSQWLNYEAGAIAGKTGHSRVATVLFGISNANVTGPLGMFQSTDLDDDEDVARLLAAINADHGEAGLSNDRLERITKRELPQLRRRLGTIERGHDGDGDGVPIRRDDRELLEEILQSVREATALRPVQKKSVRWDDSSEAQAVLIASGAWVRPGMQVVHEALGRGTIMAVGGDPGDRTVRVHFQDEDEPLVTLHAGVAKLSVDYEEPPF